MKDVMNTGEKGKERDFTTQKKDREFQKIHDKPQEPAKPSMVVDTGVSPLKKEKDN